MKGDCEGCKKAATVHFTEINAGKKIEKHYCETCPKLNNEGVAAKGHTPINELLNNFVLAHSGATKESAATCDSCGITWADFKQAGLLGCENDYALFEKDLTPIIQRAHEGATHHTGKVPARRAAASGTIVARKRGQLARLRKDLASAVEAEDYERAAKIRDEIRTAEAE